MEKELYELVVARLKTYDDELLELVAEETDLTLTGLKAWIDGRVASPRFCNLVNVAKCIGFKIVIEE